MAMEDNGAEDNILKKVPPLLSVLAFITGSQALKLICFLLAINSLIEKSQPVQEQAEYVPQKPKFERLIIRPIAPKKRRKKPKLKRRTRKTPPSPGITQIRLPK